MKYLLLVCPDPTAEAGGDDADTDPGPWVEETTRRGIRVLGDRLRPPEDSTTVRVRGGEVLVTDGPFAETKEQFGGFDVLECADLDEAIEVAAKHPMARYGVIELRPFWTLWSEE